eukprot:Lithocolla_globosa_v1_NODE_1754_length_2361_cov_8.908066.p4 type:complete len:109 gc:universal NODE_1754_length_2361_cov_8.908066:1761-2087(+)
MILRACGQNVHHWGHENVPKWIVSLCPPRIAQNHGCVETVTAEKARQRGVVVSDMPHHAADVQPELFGCGQTHVSSIANSASKRKNEKIVFFSQRGARHRLEQPANPN